MLTNKLPNLYVRYSVLLIAPFCFFPSNSWYSPGRSRKLQQIEEAFNHLNLSVLRLSTAPISCNSNIPSLHSLCSSVNPVFRLVQIILSTICLIPKLSTYKTNSSLRLWVYNSRLSEALPALILCLFFPSLPLFLQLEDLPCARSFNSGIRGICDLICLQLLTARASHIFVVSQQVGITFQRLTPLSNKPFSILPPALSDSYLSLLKARSQPFTSFHVYILYAGGYSLEKGVATLLTAFSLLPSDRYFLTLVGPVPESIQSLTASLPNLFIPGYITDESLYSYYCHSDVVVSAHHFSTRSSFIFPFKLIEYFASGCFPLTTPMAGLDSFGLPSACFFKTADELHSKLLNVHSLWRENSSIIARMSCNVREKYSHSHMIEQIASVIITHI